MHKPSDFAAPNALDAFAPRADVLAFAGLDDDAARFLDKVTAADRAALDAAGLEEEEEEEDAAPYTDAYTRAWSEWQGENIEEL